MKLINTYVIITYTHPTLGDESYEIMSINLSVRLLHFSSLIIGSLVFLIWCMNLGLHKGSKVIHLFFRKILARLIFWQKAYIPTERDLSLCPKIVQYMLLNFG
jgi:hypothetical protein